MKGMWTEEEKTNRALEEELQSLGEKLTKSKRDARETEDRLASETRRLEDEIASLNVMLVEAHDQAESLSSQVIMRDEEIERMKKIVGEDEKRNESDDSQSNSTEIFSWWFSSNFGETKLGNEFDKFVANGLDDISFWIETLLVADDDMEAESILRKVVGGDMNRRIVTLHLNLMKRKLKELPIQKFFELKHLGADNAHVLFQNGLDTVGALVEDEMPIDEELLEHLGIHRFGDRLRVLAQVHRLVKKEDRRKRIQGER